MTLPASAHRARRLHAPYLYRDGSVLVLHFEIDAAQSMMDEEHPDRLLLNYTRLMMAVLLFVPEPAHIGCIGLGGGSIPKYCYRHLPHSEITVAEINPAVIALRDTFKIPRDNHRFAVLQADGAAFVASHKDVFDILMVDAFDLHGQPRHLCSSGFYSACYRALTAKGFLVVNLCHAGTDRAISRMERIFGCRAYLLKDVTGQNQIVIIGKGESPRRKPVLSTRARALESRHPLPFQGMALGLTRSPGLQVVQPRTSGESAL